jgi:hypothetical protein
MKRVGGWGFWGCKMGPGNHLGLENVKFAIARANRFEGLGRIKCIVLYNISPARVKEIKSPVLFAEISPVLFAVVKTRN